MRTANVLVGACVLSLGGIGLPLPAVAQGGEYVSVHKVTDDMAIIGRSNGAIYSIEKGVGCLSLWRYEGKSVVIKSTGLFLGVGSMLLIPELNQECRIWDSKEIQGPTSSQLQEAPSRPSGAPSARSTCYRSSVMNPTPFMGNNGEIFSLSDGSLWKVNYEYEYLYEYYPSVIVCPSTGQLLVRGKTLNVERIAAARSPSPSESQSPGTADVIESRIDGEFSGWEGETIFKLQNGQVWQQSSYAYKYKYAYSPEVLIYRSGSVYKMRVNGVDGEIAVRRLR